MKTKLLALFFLVATALALPLQAQDAKSVRGVVTTVVGTSVTIASNKEGEMAYATDAKTKILKLDGTAGTLADLCRGEIAGHIEGGEVTLFKSVGVSLEDLAAAVARGLRRDGYAVDIAGDGGGALDRLATAEYDLVCLDLNLPDIDGRQICRTVRTNPDAIFGDEPPRVLMLTARDALEDRVGGLDEGADDYLVKPFDFPELQARVRALLRRDRPQHSAALRNGLVELDEAGHRPGDPGIVRTGCRRSGFPHPCPDGNPARSAAVPIVRLRRRRTGHGAARQCA